MVKVLQCDNELHIKEKLPNYSPKVDKNSLKD